MRILLGALSIVATFAFSSAVLADDVKKDDLKKPAVKKDACCDGDEKPAAKKDGCCDEEKKTAKKEDGCAPGEACPSGGSKKPGCDGCGGAGGAKAVAMSESDAREMIAEGKANFLPISGMSCASCEGAVATKLEKVAGVEGYYVNAAMGGAALMIAPSKMVKLSDVTGALGEGKFKINENAPIKGMITLMIDGTCEVGAKEVDAKLAAIKGVKSEKNCSLNSEKKCGTFTLVLDPKSEISIKTLRDALADMKAFTIKDMGFYGLPKEDKKS